MVSKIRFMWKIPPFAIVQYMFLGISIIITMVIFTTLTSIQIEQVFTDPYYVPQLLIVFVLPFCSLLIKQIRVKLAYKSKNYALLIPLWILGIYQFISLNIICALLIFHGMYLEYQGDMFKFKKYTFDQDTKALLIGLIFIGIVYALVVFVRVRLGIFW